MSNRFAPHNIEFPKRLAKLLQKSVGKDLLKLSTAQKITACTLGFPHCHEFDQTVGKGSCWQKFYDEDRPSLQAEQRRSAQLARLIEVS